jgi:UDP-N-acetylmuramate dehydrogenase
MEHELRVQLDNILGSDRVRVDEDMRFHTSFKAGGKADLFLTPKDVEGLISAIRLLKTAEAEWFILGNGSNVLVRDGGFRGAVIRIDKGLGCAERVRPIDVSGDSGDSKVDARFCKPSATEVADAVFAPIDASRTLVAGAGEALSSVARRAAEGGLSGLEAISGIPGSIGGALFMNAGAYDREIADVVTEADVYNADSDHVITVNALNMRLAYRESVFQRSRCVILSVVLCLRPGDKETILRAMDGYARGRNEKQPMELPSAGSFFKRPKGAYAAKLIEEAGLKGLSVGGARVSEKHAGFIVNTGGATARDILALADEVKRRVREQCGFLLEPEPRVSGDEA